MKTDKEISDIFKKLYPKEKRCGNSLFENGLYEKGFKEGFKKCIEILNKNLINQIK